MSFMKLLYVAVIAGLGKGSVMVSTAIVVSVSQAAVFVVQAKQYQHPPKEKCPRAMKK